MKTAFATVIHPNNLKYFDEFKRSLNNQTNLDFDLIVLNDCGNLTYNFDVFKMVVKLLDGNNNIFSNRMILVNHLIQNNYDVVIFGDGDDTFLPNRVDNCLKELSDKKIIFDDLNFMNSAGVVKIKDYWTNRLLNIESVNRDFLITKNVLGFGNTACKVKFLHEIKIHNPVIPDWFFFCNILDNENAFFTGKSLVNYRQHENNEVGLISLNEKSLIEMIYTVKQHYNQIFYLSQAYSSKIKELDQTMLLANKDKRKFVEFLELNKIHWFWWEPVEAFNSFILNYES